VQTRGEGVKYISGVREIVQLFFGMVESALNAHDGNSEISRLAGLPDDEVLRVTTEPCCFAAAFSLMEASGGAFNPRWRGTNTLDLGAIAKGYAIDLAVEAIGASVTQRILIDLGGNLRAVGGDWRIGIAYSQDSFVLSNSAAVATSARYFRGGHIKDARTGKEMKPSFKSVSVIHPSSAMMADALSTVLFILGDEEGRRFLRSHASRAQAIFSFPTD
jgi:thiamine biosynthesis lipoprotein ApbE